MPHMSEHDFLKMTPDEYADWVKARIAAKLRRLRKEQDRSTYDLSVPGQMTGETVRNIENGAHSPRITTLALLCVQLRTPLDVLVPDALRLPEKPSFLG